jgi:hypothetical protein
MGGSVEIAAVKSYSAALLAESLAGAACVGAAWTAGRSASVMFIAAITMIVAVLRCHCGCAAGGDEAVTVASP